MCNSVKPSVIAMNISKKIYSDGLITQTQDRKTAILKKVETVDDPNRAVYRVKKTFPHLKQKKVIDKVHNATRVIEELHDSYEFPRFLHVRNPRAVVEGKLSAKEGDVILKTRTKIGDYIVYEFKKIGSGYREGVKGFTQFARVCLKKWR